MYYLIYKTTNLINGKFYIGKHQTNNKNDSYLGSGIALEKAIKKYGRNNFIREILFECNSEEEMNQKEKEIITDDLIKNKNCYNLGLGGEGGAMFKGRHHSKETKQKLREISSGKHLSDETKQKISNIHKNKVFSDETKQKISEKAKERFSIDEEREKISKSLIAYYDKKGRKNKRRIKRRKINLDIDKNWKQCYIYKDDKEYRIYKEELEYYLNEGWKIGRNPLVKEKLSKALKGTGCGKDNSVYGTKWMYNDELKQSKMIKPELFEEYLNNGWKFGCKNKIYK
jgi:group I intron endonuclease